jgi:hypothetical protein
MVRAPSCVRCVRCCARCVRTRADIGRLRGAQLADAVQCSDVEVIGLPREVCGRTIIRALSFVLAMAWRPLALNLVELKRAYRVLGGSSAKGEQSIGWNELK